MSGAHPFDAIIIGGGPAGAAAARCLASWGRRVTLIARGDSGPSIAESIPPSALPLLERIGVRDAIERTGFIRATGNTVWWGADHDARAEDFSAAQGFQVDRSVFDDVLLREAERAGATVRRGALARDVAIADGIARVQVDDAGSATTLDAHWVLDCTGRTGLIARRGLRRQSQGSRTLALISEWTANDGWQLDDDTHTLVESYANGWAWSVPTTTSTRCFTVMVDPSITMLAGRAGLDSAYRDELARTTHLSRILERATQTGPVWARDASAYDAHRASDDGVLLVGDAASFVDPLSSFGVKKALASAWLAAVVVNTCITDASMTTHARALYDRREHAMFATLMARSAALARDAADVHDSAFWRARTLDDARAGDEDADVSALRADADVLGAFDDLRQRTSIALARNSNIEERHSPTVRGNRIVLEPQMVTPAFPDGIRYLRNVDLMMLSNMASRFTQVPDLYEAYNRSSAPVTLPDFLGALSVLIGKGLLYPL